MRVLDRPAPKWFQSLSLNLHKIEENKAAYEDPDEGVVAPSEEIFEIAKSFISRLGTFSDLELEEPRISVSANGHLGLAFGGAERSLDVLFTPKVHFYFKHSTVGEESGNGCDKAVDLITRYFRI